MKNNKYIKIAIFISLSIVLIFAAKYNVSAAYGVFNLNDADYAKISLDYENMCENIKNKHIYEERLRDMSKKTNGINMVTNIRQEQILTALNEYLSSCSVEPSSIDFSEASDMDDFKTEETDANKDKIAEVSVSISFKSSYADMLTLIDEIQGGNNAAAISSVRVVMNENDEVYGTIELVFYYLKTDENYE